MDWSIVLEIVLPLLTAMGFGFKFLISEMKDVKNEVRDINTRISRLEGHFLGPNLHKDDKHQKKQKHYKNR